MIEISFINDTLTCFLVSLILAVYLYGRIKQWIYYLPGPYNIPFVGYLSFFLAKHPHKLLAKLRYKYGGVFGFQLGQRYIIVINDYQTLKDLINREEFLYRPNVPPMKMLNEGSITRSNGDTYKREKRLSLKILHKLSSEDFLKNFILEELSYMMKELKTMEGKPCDIRYYLTRSLNNNISSLLFGRRFHYEDERALNLLKGVEMFEANNFSGSLTTFYPFMKVLVPLFGNAKYKETIRWSEILEEVIRKEVEEHKERLDENHIRDYIDAYLLKIKTPNSPHTESSLIGNCKTFYIGGIATVSFTIEWFLIAMANYQDIQSRCFEEIKERIGLECSVKVSDMKKLPYVRAVMLETYRWKAIGPLSLARSTSNGVKYKGYTLPKDAFVFANIWAIHNDPDLWKKTEKFYPENFLDEDNNFINSEFCIPFCTGRRSCPGESMANMEVFLYIVTLLQKYSFHSPDGKMLDIEGITLLLHCPKPFKILFHPRQ